MVDIHNLGKQVLMSCIMCVYVSANFNKVRMIVLFDELLLLVQGQLRNIRINAALFGQHWLVRCFGVDDVGRVRYFCGRLLRFYLVESKLLFQIGVLAVFWIIFVVNSVKHNDVRVLCGGMCRTCIFVRVWFLVHIIVIFG